MTRGWIKANHVRNFSRWTLIHLDRTRSLNSGNWGQVSPKRWAAAALLAGFIWFWLQTRTRAFKHVIDLRADILYFLILRDLFYRIQTADSLSKWIPILCLFIWSSYVLMLSLMREGCDLVGRVSGHDWGLWWLWWSLPHCSELGSRTAECLSGARPWPGAPQSAIETSGGAFQNLTEDRIHRDMFWYTVIKGFLKFSRKVLWWTVCPADCVFAPNVQRNYPGTLGHQPRGAHQPGQPGTRGGIFCILSRKYWFGTFWTLCVLFVLILGFNQEVFLIYFQPRSEVSLLIKWPASLWPMTISDILVIETEYIPMVRRPQRHYKPWRRSLALDSPHCYYDPSIIIIWALRPESTLSLSQVIHTEGNFIYSGKVRCMYFFPCPPPCMNYQIQFQRGGFFYSSPVQFSSDYGEVLWRLMEFTISPHAMRALSEQRLGITGPVSQSRSIFQRPGDFIIPFTSFRHCSFGENLHLLRSNVSTAQAFYTVS